MSFLGGVDLIYLMEKLETVDPAVKYQRRVLALLLIGHALAAFTNFVVRLFEPE